MADEKKFILDGYRFNDPDSFMQAKRELARIADIKTEHDLKDEGSLREVYDSLVESGEFYTPVGIGFLREAQKRLVKDPEQRKTMKAIPYYSYISDETVNERLSEISKSKAGLENEGDGENTKTEVNSAQLKTFKTKIRNYRIIIAFMAVMIIIPFGIVIYDKVFNPNMAAEAIVNEYASWKEELTKKEAELNEREQLLEEMTESKLNNNKAGE